MDAARLSLPRLRVGRGVSGGSVGSVEEEKEMEEREGEDGSGSPKSRKSVSVRSSAEQHRKDRVKDACHS